MGFPTPFLRIFFHIYLPYYFLVWFISFQERDWALDLNKYRCSSFKLDQHYLYTYFFMVGGLLCLTPLSTIFQLYRVGQFYWSNFLCNIILVKLERKKGDRDIMLYRVHLSMSGIRTQNVSGDMHRLHRKLKFQLTYDHDVQYDGNLMWNTRHLFIIFRPIGLISPSI